MKIKLTKEYPITLLRIVGYINLYFQRLEYQICQLIWFLKDLDTIEGVELTATLRFWKILKLLKQEFMIRFPEREEELNSFINEIREVQAFRNYLIHSNIIKTSSDNQFMTIFNAREVKEKGLVEGVKKIDIKEFKKIGTKIRMLLKDIALFEHRLRISKYIKKTAR